MATIQENIRDWSDEMRSDMSQRSEEARERTQKFLKSLPYAAVGATVHNVQRVREAVKSGFEMPSRLVESTKQSPEWIRETYEARVERGRRVVARVSERDAIEQAADQARKTGSKVKGNAKGASKSVTNLFRSAAAAMEDAAEAAFDPQDNRPYEERTLAELRELAAERDLAGRSGLNKKQLIKALRK
jgi:ElaB/YqjD/DUF883 family membrane-anchored ribosome-binding protein